MRGLAPDELVFMNLAGQVIHTEPLSRTVGSEQPNRIELDASTWPVGALVFKLMQHGQTLESGWLIHQ